MLTVCFEESRVPSALGTKQTIALPSWLTALADLPTIGVNVHTKLTHVIRYAGQLSGSGKQSDPLFTENKTSNRS